ncbi:MAG: TonB-dependent receptor [Haliscomenobacter sp.]|nr:TonB-dependent receptor [Haliscomenobacter sp.]
MKTHRNARLQRRLLYGAQWLLLGLCFISMAQAQEPVQTIRGLVLDKDTRQPLIGATVQLINMEQPVGAVTDAGGRFELIAVPVGRHKLECQYLGYETYVSDNVILNSAKELDLTIELVETGVMVEEVVVRARKLGNEPLNELAIVSARSFSAEETQRYAASANDPSRMAVGFPGVQPARDNRSDINVRGNANFGVLWRVEGVDILNPNHFARKGSSGGGITIFSVGMLSNSDFSSGAFPADYGNALSGVFDMKFRIGNKQKREYTLRAGMIGLDFATEGPIVKGRSSYLVNYRYSTLGILDAMDIRLVNERESNRFQDLSFKLHFSSEDYKHAFSVWGIGGVSAEFNEAVEGVENWKSYSDYLTRDFDTDMGAAGANYTYLVNDHSFLSVNMALTGQHIIFRNDTLSPSLSPTVINDEDYRQGQLTVHTLYSLKLSNQATLRSGVIGTRLGYDLFRRYLLEGAYKTFLDEEGNSWQGQAYSTLRWKPSPRWNINLGVHGLYFALNETSSIEPRIGVRYQASATNHLSLAYGLHSKVLPLGNYFTRVENNGAIQYPNRQLGLLKAHHVVFAVEQILSKLYRLRVETYFQALEDVPVSTNPNSTYSMINLVDGFAYRPLESSGTGRNIGIDLILEKVFSNGTFFLSSLSLLKSTYVPLNGKRYPTNFDTGLSFNFLGGKEWDLGQGKTLQTGLRILYNQGQRLTPLATPAGPDPYDPETPLVNESLAFQDRVPAYFRPDLRVAYRRDKPNTAWTLALDIQNAIARKNIDGLTRDFDPDLGKWIYREQSSLVPVLSYQIDF